MNEENLVEVRTDILKEEHLPAVRHLFLQTYSVALPDKFVQRLQNQFHSLSYVASYMSEIIGCILTVEEDSNLSCIEALVVEPRLSASDRRDVKIGLLNRVFEDRTFVNSYPDEFVMLDARIPIADQETIDMLIIYGFEPVFKGKRFGIRIVHLTEAPIDIHDISIVPMTEHHLYNIFTEDFERLNYMRQMLLEENSMSFIAIQVRSGVATVVGHILAQKLENRALIIEFSQEILPQGVGWSLLKRVCRETVRFDGLHAIDALLSTDDIEPIRTCFFMGFVIEHVIQGDFHQQVLMRLQLNEESELDDEGDKGDEGFADDTGQAESGKENETSNESDENGKSHGSNGQGKGGNENETGEKTSSKTETITKSTNASAANNVFTKTTTTAPTSGKKNVDNSNGAAAMQ